MEKGPIEKPEGEYVVIQPEKDKKLTDAPGFFDALMKFQYGTAEESDEGFRQMKQISGDLEKKTTDQTSQSEEQT